MFCDYLETHKFSPCRIRISFYFQYLVLRMKKWDWWSIKPAANRKIKFRVSFWKFIHFENMSVVLVDIHYYFEIYNSSILYKNTFLFYVYIYKIYYKDICS